MKRILNFRVVEGDPNEVDRNEILLVRDKATGKISDIMQRDGTGELVSILPECPECPECPEPEEPV